VLVAVAIVGVLALVILALLVGTVMREEEEVDRGRPWRRQRG
jgi:type II secretory pathway pseudopilin PulG